MNQEISELKLKIAALQRALDETKAELREAVTEIVGRYGLPNENLSFEYGYPCETSPTGTCIYDMNSSAGADDDCLFCHEPEERK